MADALGPIVNSLSEPFYAAGADDRLVLPHCVTTDRPFWPPSPSSPFVTAGPVEWRQVDPTGEVRAIVTFARVFQQALADRMPFAIALVELAGGVRLHAHAADPQSLAAGDRARLTFVRLAPDLPPVLHAERA
ncbi:Zn-ribbon domain-containing OB-fold protein [Sphingomonas profundi]|uniref:Zn-ribbon domain-containing OB-fold protein n=1 Tax=Alterirhizorhabdus profundi TaxID=2681549 RepID=UPI0012E84824|nr:OB-fold domain-containing protein [Sphingomonas profundi]